MTVKDDIADATPDFENRPSDAQPDVPPDAPPASESAPCAEAAASGPEASDATRGEPDKPGLFARWRPRKRLAAGEAEAAPRFGYLGVETEVAPTILSRVFNSLSLGAIFVLTALFLLQVLPGLRIERLLWFSDELWQADILAGVFEGHWLQLQLNGQFYQELPPLYFWFLAGLHKFLALSGLDLGGDCARLLHIGSAASGLLLLWATYALARFTARLDRRCAFAAGCVLISVLFLQFFFHYSSLDLFFAAFIVFGHVFMFRALTREHAPLYMGLAFLCAAVAMLSKGALGLVLPVLSAVLFSLWRGRPQRLFRGDFLLGLLFSLLPAVIWLGAIWAAGRHEAVVQMLREQIWVKAFDGAAYGGPWWYYLAMLPALFAPWCLILSALPWHRLFSASFWAGLKSARSGERQGLAFVWIFFLGAFILISLIQHKQPMYALPLLAPLAVLTGRATLQLSPLRSVVFQRLAALLFFLLAVTFVLLPVYYSGNIPSVFSWLEHIRLPAWEVKINGIFLLAVIMLGTTCLLIGPVKARRPESALLVLLLSATLFSYPLSTMTMPSLDSVVSSKDASIELKRYADLGYYPVSFKVYPGVFSYYSGMVLNETDDWAKLDRMVEAQPKIAVIMTATRWQDWTQHQGFIEVMRFWMFSNEYVLLLRDATQDEAPDTQLAPPFLPDDGPESGEAETEAGVNTPGQGEAEVDTSAPEPDEAEVSMSAPDPGAMEADESEAGVNASEPDESAAEQPAGLPEAAADGVGEAAPDAPADESLPGPLQDEELLPEEAIEAEPPADAEVRL